MDALGEDIAKDIDRVSKISIVPTLLDVICKTTGMGFAAVARVTDLRWVTCSVRDDINFGLVPGSELEIKTTICNEIRDSAEPVVIDNVQNDELFCDHHTPKMYGFQSYISYPIFLKTGEFFGTLCAIDPEPRELRNTAIEGMFTAFSDLISFHLQQVKLLEDSNQTVQDLSRKLVVSDDENRQYRHLSSHTLQEPLRKLSVFSGMLVDAVRKKHDEQSEVLALRIQKGANRFAELIRELTDFSSLGENKGNFQQTDLKGLADKVAKQMRPKFASVMATIAVGDLPVIPVLPDQIDQLFYCLFDNALKFSKPDQPPHIKVTCEKYNIPNSDNNLLPLAKEYVEIRVGDNGIGIDPSQLEKIFDLFSQLPNEIFQDGAGVGLSICRKIVRNHAGQIEIESQLGVGTTVSVILPVD